MSYEYERGPWFVAIAGYLFIRHLEKKLSCLHVRGDVTCCPGAALSVIWHISMSEAHCWVTCFSDIGEKAVYIRGDVTCCPRAAVSLVMHFSMTMSEVPTKIKRKVTYISYVKRLSISGVGDVTVALEPGSYQ